MVQTHIFACASENVATHKQRELYPYEALLIEGGGGVGGGGELSSISKIPQVTKLVIILKTDVHTVRSFG